MPRIWQVNEDRHNFLQSCLSLYISQLNSQLQKSDCQSWSKDLDRKTHGWIWKAEPLISSICYATKNPASQSWRTQNNYQMCHTSSHLNHQQGLGLDILKPSTDVCATLWRMLLHQVSQEPDENFDQYFKIIQTKNYKNPSILDHLCFPN